MAAAIYKLDQMRQARMLARHGAPPTAAVGEVGARDGANAATTRDLGAPAQLLLFTGVRYERLPDAPEPRRPRDVLELVD